MEDNNEYTIEGKLYFPELYFELSYEEAELIMKDRKERRFIGRTISGNTIVGTLAGDGAWPRIELQKDTRGIYAKEDEISGASKHGGLWFNHNTVMSRV